MSDIPFHHWINRRRGFVERTLADLTYILDRSYLGDTAMAKPSLLRRVDARVKLAASAVLIIHAASTQSVWTIAAILCAVIFVALVGHLPAAPLVRLWFTVGLLAACLAAPAMFMTPGKIVLRVPVIGWSVTDTGAVIALKLVLRALTSSTIAAVLVLSTQWQYVLKAMRRFGVPVVAVVLIGMSYRYIVLFLQTAIELTNARKSRTAGRLPMAERRRLALSSVGVLVERAFTLGNEVHLAMQARGYRGEVSVLDEFTMATRDWLVLFSLLTFELMLLWM